MPFDTNEWHIYDQLDESNRLVYINLNFKNLETQKPNYFWVSLSVCSPSKFENLKKKIFQKYQILAPIFIFFTIT